MNSLEKGETERERERELKPRDKEGSPLFAVKVWMNELIAIPLSSSALRSGGR